jgi:two-component system phosphate regulon sensor histidine kinase PhoR
MITVKTKENASLLMAFVAAIIVALVMTIVGGVVWWLTLCISFGVFVVMAIFSLFMMKQYVAYKLKPIYSMVLSRDVHTTEIVDEMKDKHVENISEELTAWADDNDKEIARLTKERDSVERDIQRAEGKLNNQGFIAKAPAQLVEQEKAKLEVNKDKLAKLNARIADLQNM